ncbi:MAG: ABC transporter permease, partial [bacterium]
MNFVARRLMFYATAFFLAISFNFLIPRLMPGDPVDALFAGAMGKMDPSQMDAVRAMYGFVDGPLWEQYFSYLLSVLSWDLGPSILLFPTSVTDVLMIGLPWTVFLAGTSLILTVVIGVLAGTYAASNRGRWFDSFVPPITSFISAFPYVVSAMVIFFILGLKLKWFPLSYAYDPELDPALSWEFISSVSYHATLPMLSMIMVGISGWLFNMRNALINVLGEDYITMAEAKGLTRWRVMIRYAQRNAMLPVMTAVSMAVGFVLA